MTRPDRPAALTTLGSAAFAVLLAIGIALAVLCGCTTTRYVPVESVRTEYRDRDVERVVTDTVTDTRVVVIKGDTVIDWRDRWHRQTDTVHDTCYIERTDSVPVPYPVERRLSRWEQTKQDLGGYALAAVTILCVAVVWLIRRMRRRA